jgi:hypothetical protein
MSDPVAEPYEAPAIEERTQVDLPLIGGVSLCAVFREDRTAQPRRVWAERRHASTNPS